MNKDDIGIKSNKECSPLQEILNAHMQYLESIQYLKPNDFTQNPDKLLEKQIHYTISNMLKLQEYIQKSWSIFGKSLTQNAPFFTTNVSDNNPKTLSQNFPLNFSDNLLGRISNSIFTPTYMGLNPFKIAESFASDLTTDLTSKLTKTTDSLGTKPKKKASKSKKK